MQARSIQNFELEALEGKLQEVTNDDGNTISGARTFWIIKPHTMVVVTTDEKGCFHAPVDNLNHGMRNAANMGGGSPRTVGHPRQSHLQGDANLTF